MINPVSLMIPKLILHLFLMILFLPMSQTGIDHFIIPHVLHDFPTKHYKYLPIFDGESKNLTTEKYIQSFEHLLDLFETEYDDVCKRDIYQPLRGDVKEWFKYLQTKSIGKWEEFSDRFLRL